MGLEANAVAAIQSFTHLLIHSFHTLMYLLSARHCSECWENSKNKIKSLPPGSVHSNVSIAGIVTGVSPSCPRPGPLHCQPGRQMLDLLHLPTSRGHHDLCIFPAPRKYKALPLYLERSRQPAAALRQRGDLVLLQKRQMKTQGTQARRCH